jgi:URI fold toxin 2 of polymorphic toxin system component
MKYGISGETLNKNGTSRRANRQVAKLNKNGGAYTCEVLVKGLPGRAAALQWERDMVSAYFAKNSVMPPLQTLPKPSP